MKNFYSYPSIGQFANTIRHVKQKTRFFGLDETGAPIYNNDPLPKIKYIGTVKTHGTNAALVYDVESETFGFQSRERVLSLEQDNAGFMLFMSSKLEELKFLSNEILSEFPELEKPSKVVVYGEWAGSNIQKGVAVNGLPKMFIIFGVKFVYDYETDEDGIGTVWVDRSRLSHIQNPDVLIFNILNFPTYEVEIDFERPEIAQNIMSELVLAVEAECPIGKAFGNSGIGEGLVFSPKESIDDSGYWFKAKGAKHSASKVKKLVSIDIESIESIRAYVEMFVTENRMEQMFDKLTRELLLEPIMTSMGEFIRLVYADCIKESQDEIVKNQLDVKKLGSPIANVARRWYVNKTKI